MISPNVLRSWTLLYRSTVILGLMAIVRILLSDPLAEEITLQFQKSAQEYMDMAKLEIADLLERNERDVHDA